MNATYYAEFIIRCLGVMHMETILNLCLNSNISESKRTSSLVVLSMNHLSQVSAEISGLSSLRSAPWRLATVEVFSKSTRKLPSTVKIKHKDIIKTTLLRIYIFVYKLNMIYIIYILLRIYK